MSVFFEWRNHWAGIILRHLKIDEEGHVVSQELLFASNPLSNTAEHNRENLEERKEELARSKTPSGNEIEHLALKKKG